MKRVAILPIALSLLLFALYVLPGCSQETVVPTTLKDIDELIKLLEDKDEGVRRKAASALGNIGPAAKEAVPALIITLKDKDKLVSGSAARALGYIGLVAKEVVPALTEASKDKNADVRTAVQEALNRIKAAS